MKKVILVNVGGTCFTIEIDAYETLKDYLDEFEASLEENERKEVMEDIENRIAEIFQERVRSSEYVVDEKLVEHAIRILGKPEKQHSKNNEEYPRNDQTFSKLRDKIENTIDDFKKQRRRYYRDPDNKKIAGICSGIAEYFDIDVTLVRILGVISAFFGGFTILVYIVIWIIVPEALSSTQKLELRGLPITPENIKKYPATEKDRKKK